MIRNHTLSTGGWRGVFSEGIVADSRMKTLT